MEEGILVNSELYKLLMTYGELDDDFINRAFEIIMGDEPELEPFVNDFSLSRKPSDSYGTYSREDKKIILYPENIKDSRRVTNKKLQALVTIRHELEHARNLQRLYECRHDIESMVIRFAMKDYAVKYGLDRLDPFDTDDFFIHLFPGKRAANYALNPDERIANIKSWKYLVNLLKNQRRTLDLLEARVNLYEGYTRGYVDNGSYLNPPTYEFLLNMGMYHEFYLFKKAVEQQQYVFDTRLMYGLPLKDGEEYDKKILRKVLLQKSKRQ